MPSISELRKERREARERVEKEAKSGVKGKEIAARPEPSSHGSSAGLPSVDEGRFVSHPRAPGIKTYTDGPTSGKSLKDYISERRGSRASSVVDPNESVSQFGRTSSVSTRAEAANLGITLEEVRALRAQNALLLKQQEEMTAMMKLLLKDRKK